MVMMFLALTYGVMGLFSFVFAIMHHMCYLSQNAYTIPQTGAARGSEETLEVESRYDRAFCACQGAGVRQLRGGVS